MLRARRRAVGAHVGADVGVRLSAQAQDGAVALARDLQRAGDVARVIGGDQVLAPVLDPFHRAAGVAGGERDEEILRVELAAHAEPAADVVLHHADRAFGETELCGKDATVGERHLGGAEQP